MKTAHEKQDIVIGQFSQTIHREEKRTDPNILEQLIEDSRIRIEAYEPTRQKYEKEKNERISPKFIHTGK